MIQDEENNGYSLDQREEPLSPGTVEKFMGKTHKYASGKKWQLSGQKTTLISGQCISVNLPVDQNPKNNLFLMALALVQIVHFRTQ